MALPLSPTPEGMFLEIPVINGELWLAASFYSVTEAGLLLQKLREEVIWQQETIRIYGKSYVVPRLVAWVGDEGKAYRYSGISHDPLPWTATLSTIKRKIEAATGNHFNTVLLNWYRNGNDSMGWHADNEPELGSNPVIASLSLGETRMFRFRQTDNHRNSFDFPLENGSLLLMAGALQHHWQHSIPKSAKPMGDRINLTFRTIL